MYSLGEVGAVFKHNVPMQWGLDVEQVEYKLILLIKTWLHSFFLFHTDSFSLFFGVIVSLVSSPDCYILLRCLFTQPHWKLAPYKEALSEVLPLVLVKLSSCLMEDMVSVWRSYYWSYDLFITTCTLMCFSGRFLLLVTEKCAAAFEQKLTAYWAPRQKLKCVAAPQKLDIRDIRLWREVCSGFLTSLFTWTWVLIIPCFSWIRAKMPSVGSLQTSNTFQSCFLVIWQTSAYISLTAHASFMHHVCNCNPRHLFSLQVFSFFTCVCKYMTECLAVMSKGFWVKLMWLV